jgi:hypothetical protein
LEVNFSDKISEKYIRLKTFPNDLTPSSKALLEKVVTAPTVKKFPTISEPDCS